MSMKKINAITRERYETGAYGNAHFEISLQVEELLRQKSQSLAPPSWDTFLQTAQMTGLYGINIFINNELSDGEWRLVDNLTEEVIHSGVLEEDDS